MSGIDKKVLSIAVITSLCMPMIAGSAEQLDMAAETREFEIVPCLLPARVRKLGNMTYPERRRLKETSARECRLQGGEYTFYDRAKPESAVAFFSKLAQDGNLEAQVSLGDVYQYLFAEPNYEQAARWYQQASDGGNKKGMMQLARLYERGFGVEADPLMATNLWREATGAGEELVLASTMEKAQTRAMARINDLTQQLRDSNEAAEATRYELTVARSEVDNRKEKLQSAQTQLAEVRRQLKASDGTLQSTQQVAALRIELTEREGRIQQQRDQIASLEDNLGVRQAQLTANLRQVERRNRQLNEELENVTAAADESIQQALAQIAEKDQQLTILQKDLAGARMLVQSTDTSYTEIVSELDKARVEAGDSRRAKREVEQLEEQTAEQLARLESQRNVMTQLESQLAAVSGEAETLRSRLDDRIDVQAETDAKYASAEAELQRIRTRMNELQTQLADANTQLSRSADERKLLEAQASSSSGDDARVNQLQDELLLQNQDIRTQQQQIAKLTEQVNQYASELTEIRLKRSSLAMRTPMLDTSSIRLPRDQKIGKYHALVIGNNDYEYLTDLKNAANDARAVHEVLQNEYGFSSTLLLNGTEAQMYNALNDMGKRAQEDDLVIIYYAGHGYRSKNESYWLPVELASQEEAEVDGISSLKVADWVRTMSARHVMIVADSCYSGSGIHTTGGAQYDIATLEGSLKYYLGGRSRMMLTSGDVSPVMDGGGTGEHSIFTEAFVGLLSENKGVLPAGALHKYLVERVKYASDGTRVNQTPQFGTIESAGHEAGHFVFLHRNLRGV